MTNVIGSSMQTMQNQLKNKIHKLEKSMKSDKKVDNNKDFNPHVWRFGDKANSHNENKSQNLMNNTKRNMFTKKKSNKISRSASDEDKNSPDSDQKDNESKKDGCEKKQKEDNDNK